MSRETKIKFPLVKKLFRLFYQFLITFEALNYSLRRIAYLEIKIYNFNYSELKYNTKLVCLINIVIMYIYDKKKRSVSEYYFAIHKGPNGSLL